MEPARAAARRLVAIGKIVITQHNQIVDPSTAKGPIRLRSAREPPRLEAIQRSRIGESVTNPSNSQKQPANHHQKPPRRHEKVRRRVQRVTDVP